jgi:hypothetical protein
LSLVYTRRFGAIYQTAAGDFSLFTADATAIWVLRDLVVANLTEAAGHFSVYVQSGPAARYDFFDGDVPADTSTHLDLRQQLPSGDNLRVTSTTVTGWSCVATGYRLAT